MSIIPMFRFNNLIQTSYQRLLNSEKKIDYFYCILIALIPIGLSCVIGIWNPIEVGCNESTTSFREATNFLAHTIILPTSLWLLRCASNILFGINIRNVAYDNVPILTFFSERTDIQNKIHGNLKRTLLHPIIFLILFLIVSIHFYFDVGELFRQYILTYLGKKQELIIEHCTVKNTLNIFSETTPLYWANLFLFNKSINIKVNFLFTILAYIPEFLIIFIAYTGLIMFLLHNCFYLKLIYQRRRVTEAQIRYHIVLNFKDQAKRFGLTRINKAFNLQIFVLIVAGILALLSRYTVVPTYARISFNSINFNNVDEFIKSTKNKFLPSVLSFNLNSLFSEFGQRAILIGWLLGFLIVILPSIIKFLPIFSLDTLINLGSNLDPPSYLKEFIKPDVEEQEYQHNGEFNFAKAAKDFKKNSFWPMGDSLASLFLLKQVDELAKIAKNSAQPETKDSADNALTMLKGIFSGVSNVVKIMDLIPKIAQIFGVTL